MANLNGGRTRDRRQIFALVIVAAATLLATNAWAQKAPVLSLRITANGGAEVEGHISSVGVGITFVPKFHTVEASAGGTVVCKAEFDRTFYFARYFFRGPKDSWYVGGAGYNERLATASDCGESALSGLFPLVGYHWLWDSGFNLDLGLRPGILALGWSF